MCPYFA
ncbi:hypothetical protein VTH06DRAFT_2788 [Thermothelomyces fergusii]